MEMQSKTKQPRFDKFGARLCDVIRVNGKPCNRRSNRLDCGISTCPVHTEGGLT